MNRITAEQVVEAFRATGLKAKRGDYFIGDNCACGLGALYYKETTSKSTNLNEIFEFLDMHFGGTYHRSFACGFDGLITNEYEDVNGYEDGKTAWQACIEAGLVEE